MKFKIKQKVKPCPFCGSTNVGIESFDLEPLSPFVTITCLNCGATGPRKGIRNGDNFNEIENDLNDLVVKWNKVGHGKKIIQFESFRLVGSDEEGYLVFADGTCDEDAQGTKGEGDEH